MTNIRRATIGEAPIIASVHARAHWEAYSRLFGVKARALDVADLEWRWRHALKDDDVALVAAEAGLIVGIGHARGHRVEALYLLAVHRRQGIGKALLARMLSLMHQRGIAEAEFDVLAINADAIAFYRSCGAHEIGRATRSGPDGNYDDVVFSISTAPCTPQWLG
jgi:ribosomal protein S18 acetylase RimI-like enzyme